MPTRGSWRKSFLGFSRVVASTELTIEVELGPATGPLVFVPTTQLPGVAGRFEIEVLFDSDGSDPDQVFIHELHNSVMSSSLGHMSDAITEDAGVAALTQRHWFHYERRGSWCPGRTAGGCRISSMFGQNTAFLAVPEKSHVAESRPLEMYAVVSFHRSDSVGIGDGNSSSNDQVIRPLVAGCHCLIAPEQDRGEESVKSASVKDPSLPHEDGGRGGGVDPSEAAQSSLGAFEVFRMFGEKRMQLSTPCIYPELGDHSEATAYMRRKREGQRKDGKSRQRTSIMEVAEVSMLALCPIHVHIKKNSQCPTAYSCTDRLHHL